MMTRARIMLAHAAGAPRSVWRFYADGFKSMTVGKTLWAIILIKLFIFFAVIKLLFFPDVLKRDCNTDEERADKVRHELIDRSAQ